MLEQKKNRSFWLKKENSYILSRSTNSHSSRVYETRRSSLRERERQKDTTMERLLQPSSSSSISPSKFPLKTSLFLPCLCLSDMDFVYESLVSCNHVQNPYAYTHIRSNKSSNSFNGSPSSSLEAEESKLNSGFIQRIMKTASEQ